jgi:hypothetical protein
MQALSLAGGTTTFANVNGIFVLRRELDRQRTLPFNFNDVANGCRRKKAYRQKESCGKENNA